ncbi:hypothetical protein [Thioclava electrotropha]|uniref:Uncharacterized protein n=1 Tax=Thioclava electrotropha TaxID=1549850 RepID=A0ABX6YVD0_9RHOB|nr:hypothetical protein [Thioclava electrotropha]QPZ91811.1 hypothetical protein AKL02_013525 [Thioclava electrotropha]
MGTFMVVPLPAHALGSYDDKKNRIHCGSLSDCFARTLGSGVGGVNAQTLNKMSRAADFPSRLLRVATCESQL